MVMLFRLFDTCMCPAALPEMLLVCDCAKPFSPVHCMRGRYCAGARTVCQDSRIELGWRACVHKSAQASTREPADTDLQCVFLLVPVSVLTSSWLIGLVVLVRML